MALILLTCPWAGPIMYTVYPDRAEWIAFGASMARASGRNSRLAFVFDALERTQLNVEDTSCLGIYWYFFSFLGQ